MGIEKWPAVLTVVLIIASIYNLMRMNLIQTEYEKYKIKNDVLNFGHEISRLAKAVSTLEKEKTHNEVVAALKRREVSFAQKGKTPRSYSIRGGALLGCKQTDPYDPLVREQSIIPDQVTPKRKEVVERVPHATCPRALNPKVNANEYLFWIDKANKKHMKFQADFEKKLNCDRHRSTAQFSQDIRLHRNFFHFSKELIFVEVGAFDGVVFSNTLFEERCLGWRGLCIEPQRRFAGIIQKSRKCGVINAAVGNNKDEEEGKEMDIVVGGVLGGEDGSLSKWEKAKKLARQYPEHKNVARSFKLSTIFRANHISHVDHLAIDCEGCELQVLRSLDYSEVKVRVIQIETNGKDKEIKEYLREVGFIWVEDMGEDAIFVTREEVAKYAKS